MGVAGPGQVRFAGNGGARIAFEDLGGAGGDPLLLITGLAVSRFWWPQALVGELVRRGFHVVAYDQRDAGQPAHFPAAGRASPVAAVLRRRSAAYTAEDMADDAVAVLDAAGGESARLSGHSLGGQLAQRTALRHPGRDQASGIRDTAAQSRQAGAKWHGGRLSRLRVPALVLHGAADPLLRPAAARRTAAAIEGARLVILPGAGHYLPAGAYPQIAGEVRALADRAAAAALEAAGSAEPGEVPA
jgi:pimeloyl-ACP methyl ester carboxylesterase